MTSDRQTWPVPAPGAEPRSGSQALERALAVLDCFQFEPELGVSQVARTLDLSVSTAHRLIKALSQGGLLSKDGATGLYRLGPRLATLGSAAAQRLGYEASLPIVRGLAAEVGESVTLGVLDGRDSLTVLGVSPAVVGAVPVAPGTRGSIQACAMARMLNAFAGVSERPDDPRTSESSSLASGESPPGPGVSADEAREVRDRGWAASSDRRGDRATRSISVPVYAADGGVAAALAVAMSADRVTEDEYATWGVLLGRRAELLRSVLT